ncbi:MAG TPA: tripartite tricarboxylate transporter substrate binding protein [Thermodesulfobacteriota bacterium]
MRLSVLAAVAGILVTVASAHAQGFTPTRPVEVVVHTGPGGGTDAFARAMFTALRKDGLLPVNFLVVNKTGGGSATAMRYLQEKTGDDHTIAIFSSVWITDPLVQKEAPLTIDQLTPISRLVLEPALFVVNAKSPYKTLKDFIDAAKANPGQLKQSGGSVLARDAVVRHVLRAHTGADWSFISFPSGGERVAALLGGHVDIMMIEPSEAGELIRSGRLRALAQIADTRIPGFPDVPTLKEAGFDVPNVPQARGVVAPPKMPAAAVAYYEDLFRRASQSPAYKQYLADTQLENAYLGSSDLAGFLKQYQNQMREILKGAGVAVVR